MFVWDLCIIVVGLEILFMCIIVVRGKLLNVIRMFLIIVGYDKLY